MISESVSKMDCPRCGGVGKIPLPDGTSETLAAVVKIGRATVLRVQGELDPNKILHPTAFNNRLARMAAAGLLKRERVSKSWVYSKA